MILRSAGPGPEPVAAVDTTPISLTETALEFGEDSDLLAEYFEVITFVDELLAVTDPTVLDDAALAELLF